MERVHIVGAPRTGTTLLLEMMLTAYRFDAFGQTEVSVLVPPPPNAGTTCTKYPTDLRVAGPLLEADPGQWFLHAVRDPRDVVVSVHNRAPDRYWTNLGQWRRITDYARPILSHPRFIEVRYEDLVGAPDETQCVIEERMPFLERVGGFSSFHERSRPSRQSFEAMRTLRPVDASSIGAWRKHKPRLAGQIKLHGSPTPDLIELNYERDGTWERELDGVEPDTQPGFWPDRPDEARMAAIMQREKAALEAYLRVRGLRLPE